LEKDDFMLIGVTEHIIADFFPAVKSYITKYNYDGELDESFGENGRTYLTDDEETFKIHPRAIKILNDQSIIIAGYDNVGLPPRAGRLAFCKLRPIGNLVTNFANNGVWIIDNNPQNIDYFYSIIEDTNNGNLVFTCMRVFPYSWDAYYSIYNFYPDGTINSDFGTDGCYFPFNIYVPDGEVQTLQSGSKYLSRNSDKITSIDNNGTLDTNFNNTGVFSFSNYEFIAMKLQEVNKLVALVHFNNFSTIAMVRFNIPYEVSIKETPYTENRINIFPNPTNGELSVVSYQFPVERIDIFDVYGRKILTSFVSLMSLETTTNIAHLPAGIYFVKITTEAGIQTQKIIKQ